MAEILISLTIIGIIAAITLPSLRANINEKAWATQRKALYSRMSQAISMMPSLNGYGVVMNANGTINNNATASKAAQAFVSEGLSKVLKINNICDYEHLKDCGLPDKITTIDKNHINFPAKLSQINSRLTSNTTYTVQDITYSNTALLDTFASAFSTQNGDSVAVFYNPNCIGESKADIYFAQPLICVNFIYDLNGRKGPNTAGSDIGFITALYSSDSSVVAPVMVKHSRYQNTYQKAVQFCRTKHNARIPNIEELIALYANPRLMDINTYVGYVSSTKYLNSNTRRLLMASGFIEYGPETSTTALMYVRCVKRN